jgi:hypothetical protein
MRVEWLERRVSHETPRVNLIQIKESAFLPQASFFN